MKSPGTSGIVPGARFALIFAILIAATASIVSADDRWDHYSDSTYEYWDLDEHHKFRWTISSGQWCHFSTYGSWKTLSTPGLGPTFIGDGSWYDMGYGLKYRYDLNSDYGFFGRGANYRFHYRYNPGQWYTSGCAGGWYTIGAAGMSAGVLGDGGVYDLGSGVKFRYDAATDYGFYHNAAQYRFYYRYTPGQWYTSGYGGGWYTMGTTGLCAGVLADGSVHSLGNGLAFRYDAANDYGFYSRGANYRFYYRYIPGQWYTSGYGGGWRTIGALGTCAAVLANGNLYDLGNGLKFRYHVGDDYGFYDLGADALDRFYYHYTPGQWYTAGYGGDWYELGSAGLPAWGFFDGTARDLGNGFEFRYDQALDCGYFTRDDAERFYYAYTPGQWSHRGNSSEWTALTDAGYSAAFVGNGADHDLGNGFSYHYANDSGVFRHDDNDRFSYRYGSSQWYHAGNATDMAALTAGGYSAAFIGDGGWYAVGNGFTYSYFSATTYGYFKVGDTERFSYDYEQGQWFHGGNTTDMAVLTSTVYSAAFVGDGHSHYLGNGVSYYYSDGNGWFKVGGHERFSYEYGPSQWGHHRGSGGVWTDLSTEGVSALFVGDGGWHNLGTGWRYSYASTSDYAYYRSGGTERFSYRYGPGQWYHKGDTTGWAALTAGDYSLAFIGVGADHDLGNGFNYTYLSASDAGHFKAGTTDRFLYEYGPSQWSHKGDSTEWGTLSATGVLAQFVGDGSWRGLGNGLTYQYSAADGRGYFKVGTALRFSYTYGSSQWSHKGNSTDWVALTGSDYIADFIGDGGWHALGDGWSYQYLAANGEGHFKTGDKERFAYSYGPSQWRHKGDTTDWATLSGTGAFLEFVGDGAWHDLVNGFTYSYVSASDEGHFKLGDAERFSYRYEPGQWYHRGGTTDWAALTPGDYSARFLGDGAWYELGNGFSYYYSIQEDRATFGLSHDPEDAERFLYFYNGGQWYHIGDTTNWPWAALSSGDCSALFLGDGADHELGTGWTYSYDVDDDQGYFKTGGTERFSYSYAPSQWSHKGDTGGWAVLSAGNRSAWFIGDGAWYELGNGFSYSYAATGEGTGYFMLGTAQRFSYAYGAGQWSHRGNQDTGWIALTGTGYAADFAGNGAQHDLGGGITYYYTINGDNGWFRVGGHERFWYKYAPGQWYHSRADSGSWQALSAAGISALYVGDGNWHDLGTGWDYQYVAANGAGYFKAGDKERFSYTYGTGQWSHRGDDRDWAALSAEWVSAGFVGDGGWHDLGDGFTYQYVNADDEGYFKLGSSERFLYKYFPEQWFHRGDHTDWTALTVTLYSAQFVGDGADHDLGEWLFKYSITNDYGIFSDTHGAALAYSYAPGQWLHKGNTTEWGALTAGNYSIAFIGDGEWHDLGTGWSYYYNRGQGVGYFRAGVGERFAYDYGTSQWRHEGNTGGLFALSAEGVTAEFVGDGNWIDLGNGFTYRYLIADDHGYWRLGADERFSYTYGPGQWSHKGNGTNWVALTGQNWDAQFVGDGDWYLLNSQWSYSYDVAHDIGSFRDNVDDVNEDRFAYFYTEAAWYHRSSNSDWIWLCTTFSSISAQFVGDGGWHDMATGWWYSYDPEGHTAYWGKGEYTDSHNWRFYYTYTIGLWQHKGYHGDFHPLGSHGWWDPTFLGDGAWHWVNGNDDNYAYSFDFGLDHGYWYADPSHQGGEKGDYKYFYDTGWWWFYHAGGWGQDYGPKASTAEYNPIEPF